MEPATSWFLLDSLTIAPRQELQGGENLMGLPSKKIHNFKIHESRLTELKGEKDKDFLFLKTYSLYSLSGEGTLCKHQTHLNSGGGEWEGLGIWG